jgi:hypothetical protein
MKGVSYFKFTEFLLALMTALWGVWLLLPFQTYSGSEVYRIMATIATEIQAGSIMFLTGLGWLVLIFTGNHFGLRKIVVLFALFLWIILDIVYICGNPASTATIGNTGIVALITHTYMQILEESQCRWKHG